MAVFICDIITIAKRMIKKSVPLGAECISVPKRRICFAKKIKRRRPDIAKLKYKTAEEMQTAIEAYFKDCEGKPLTDDSGEIIFDKRGDPVIVGAHPPTVTGLALWLGFKSRQTMLNYQARSKAFDDILTIARSKCEEYAERCLYDNSKVTGAKFSLENNFSGWGKKADETEKKMQAELPQLYKALSASESSKGKRKKS